MGMNPVETLNNHKNTNDAMYVFILSDRTEDDGIENKCFVVCVMILNDSE
jgi:hypothetical protein